MNESVNIDLIRDHVDTFILRFLSNGDSYGYDIHKAISDSTDGVYQLKQATLYSCLKRLEKQGFISSYEGELSNGGKRRYYSLTDTGRDFLNKDIEQWEFSRTLLNRLLSDKDYDLTSVNRPFEPSSLRPRTKRSASVDTSSTQDLDSIDELELLDDGTPEFEETKSSIQAVDSSTIEKNESIQNKEKREPNNTKIVDSSLLNEEKVEDSSVKQSVGNSSILGTKVNAEQIDFSEALNISNMEAAVDESPILEQFLFQQALETNENEYRNELDRILTPNSNIFTEQNSETIEKNNIKHEEKTIDSCMNYSELKEHMQSSGYNLRPYVKTTSTSYYSTNFVFTSKLRRDSLFLTYLFMLIELISSFFALDKYAMLGYKFYIIVGAILFIIPFIGILLYLAHPDKRTRADFDFKHSIAGGSMIFINCFVVCMLLSFFLFGSDISRPSTMVKPILFPTLLFLNIPMYSVFYSLLFNSNHYTLNQ